MFRKVESSLVAAQERLFEFPYVRFLVDLIVLSFEVILVLWMVKVEMRGGVLSLGMLEIYMHKFCAFLFIDKKVEYKVKNMTVNHNGLNIYRLISWSTQSSSSSGFFFGYVIEEPLQLVLKLSWNLLGPQLDLHGSYWFCWWRNKGLSNLILIFSGFGFINSKGTMAWSLVWMQKLWGTVIWSRWFSFVLEWMFESWIWHIFVVFSSWWPQKMKGIAFYL